MNDARNFHVIDAVPDRLKVSPPRSHRRWSGEAKARLIEASLAPGANVSAIAREAGLAPSQLFGWRRKALKGDAENRREGEGRLGFVEIATAADCTVTAMIGVDPAHQGEGHGDALMAYALAQCDRDHAPAYLESSNPRNISFYQWHGFEPLGAIQVGSSPTLIPMLRRPC
jgi:transposase